MNNQNQEFVPTKKVKIANKKEISKFDRLKALDEEVKKYLSKKEKFEVKAKELSLCFSQLLEEKGQETIQQKDFENSLLKSFLEFASELNEDPDYPNDYGTYSLITILFKSLVALKDKHYKLEDNYKSLVNEINRQKNVENS